MGESDAGSPDFKGQGLRAEQVLESLEEPITVIAPDYRVIYINSYARTLFGITAKTPGDLHCYEVSHRLSAPCSGSGHPCPMEGARRQSASVTVLHEHYDAEGGKRMVEIIASPMVDDDGNFAGIVESQRDVTEREEAEALLRSYAHDLRESNKIKDLFIDIMRHDLLGPAGVIRNAAQIAKEREGEPWHPDDLDLIIRSSRKMIDLIQNASVLAKLEKAEKLSFEPVDVAEMIRDAAADLRAAAAEKKVALRIATGSRCRVAANPLLLSVLSNLIGNAIKYGPESAEVVVAAEGRNGSCLLSVADRGEGIADEDKREIFTRFSRLDKKGVKGSGLGLAIVKRVVEIHGGRTWVEDNPGGGSVFFVELKSAQ